MAPLTNNVFVLFDGHTARGVHDDGGVAAGVDEVDCG
jgi:hypothetical protein